MLHHFWCWHHFFLFLTRWCPSSLAKLVYNSHFTMVYGRYNYSIHGLYKPTNFTGGHHPGWLKTYFVDRCEGSIQLSGWPGSARSEDSGAPSPPPFCAHACPRVCFQTYGSRAVCVFYWELSNHKKDGADLSIGNFGCNLENYGWWVYYLVWRGVIYPVNSWEPTSRKRWCTFLVGAQFRNPKFAQRWDLSPRCSTGYVVALV